MKENKVQKGDQRNIWTGVILSQLVVFFIGGFFWHSFQAEELGESGVGKIFLITILLTTISGIVAGYFWEKAGFRLIQARITAIVNVFPILVAYIYHPNFGASTFILLFVSIIIVIMAQIGAWFAYRFFEETN